MDLNRGSGGRHRQPGPGFRVTDRDKRVAADVFLHGLLSSGQVQVLHFATRQNVNLRLQRLVRAGYLRRLPAPAGEHGAQARYVATPQAAEMIAARLGLDQEAVRAAIRAGAPNPAFQRHTLAVVDFYLDVRAAAASEPDVALEAWRPELLCRHAFELRPKGGGLWRSTVFRPDGYLRLAAAGTVRDAFLELDLGHTGRRQFAGKLAAFRAFVGLGLYATKYGSEALGKGSPCLLVVTTGPRRLAHLAELAAFEKTPALLATFADLAAGGPLAAVWQTPSGQRLRLVEARSRGPP